MRDPNHCSANPLRLGSYQTSLRVCAMKVLTVYAHPNPQSRTRTFSAQLLPTEMDTCLRSGGRLQGAILAG